MATAVAGKKIVYLYRLLEEQATADGVRLAFVTENGRTNSKDADSTATKDGSIRTPGTAEVEITCTSILAQGDTMIGKLENAMNGDKVIEIWEANLEEPVTGAENQFAGRYFQGYITEFEKSSSAEDMCEISLTFGINGVGVAGNVTVTTEQQEDTNYVFVDTPATGGTTPDVALSRANASVAEGDSIRLTATTIPAGQTVTWATGAAATATVEDGVVTGVAAGSTTITASITVDGTTYTDTCALTVTSAGA